MCVCCVCMCRWTTVRKAIVEAAFVVQGGTRFRLSLSYILCVSPYAMCVRDERDWERGGCAEHVSTCQNYFQQIAFQNRGARTWLYIVSFFLIIAIITIFLTY